MKTVHELLRFTLVGGTCFSLNLLVLWVGTSYAGYPYLVSTCVSFILACIVGYVLNHSFTFAGRDRPPASTRGFLRYVTVATGTLLASLVLMYVFVSQFGLHYLLANVTAGILLLALNFVMHRAWTYSRGHLASPPASARSTKQ
jgi:putative flippase GtrA